MTKYKIIENKFYFRTIYMDSEILAFMTSGLGRTLTWEIIQRVGNVTSENLNLKLCLLGKSLINMISKIASIDKGYVRIAESAIYNNAQCLQVTLQTNAAFKKMQNIFTKLMAVTNSNECEMVGNGEQISAAANECRDNESQCKRYRNCKYRIGRDFNCCDYCPVDYKTFNYFINWQRKELRLKR